jgi:hypothetical protein
MLWPCQQNKRGANRRQQKQDRQEEGERHYEQDEEMIKRNV